MRTRRINGRRQRVFPGADLFLSKEVAQRIEFLTITDACAIAARNDARRRITHEEIHILPIKERSPHRSRFIHQQLQRHVGEEAHRLLEVRLQGHIYRSADGEVGAVVEEGQAEAQAYIALVGQAEDVLAVRVHEVAVVERAGEVERCIIVAQDLREDAVELLVHLAEEQARDRIVGELAEGIEARSGCILERREAVEHDEIGHLLVQFVGVLFDLLQGEGEVGLGIDHVVARELELEVEARVKEVAGEGGHDVHVIAEAGIIGV